MKLPIHKCTPYCKPEERIHCIPNLWTANKSSKDWQQQLYGLKVIDSREESDVSLDMIKRSLQYAGTSFLINHSDKNTVGYLVWIQEPISDDH